MRVCAVVDCDRTDFWTKTLCKKHYQQQRAKGKGRHPQKLRSLVVDILTTNYPKTMTTQELIEEACRVRPGTAGESVRRALRRMVDTEDAVRTVLNNNVRYWRAAVPWWDGSDPQDASAPVRWNHWRGPEGTFNPKRRTSERVEL